MYSNLYLFKFIDKREKKIHSTFFTNFLLLLSEKNEGRRTKKHNSTHMVNGKAVLISAYAVIMFFVAYVKHFLMQTYKEWILRTMTDTWNLFYKKFTALWDEHKDGSGEAYLPAIYNNPELQLLVKQKFMTDLFHDTLGFGAAKMIRLDN